MGNGHFFLEVHCEAHEIPELMRAPLSLSPPSRDPASTPGGWHQWLQSGWGTMSTPRGASQRHGCSLRTPWLQPVRLLVQLRYFETTFPRASPGASVHLGWELPSPHVIVFFFKWLGGIAYGFVEGWPGPWSAAFPKITDAHQFAIPSLLVAPKMDLVKARDWIRTSEGFGRT